MNLSLQFESRQALLEEVERNLLKGRTFVKGKFSLAVRQRTELTLLHPGTEERLSLAVEVVFPTDDGIGLEILDLSDEKREEIRNFAGLGASDSFVLEPTEPELQPDAGESEASDEGEFSDKGDEPEEPQAAPASSGRGKNIFVRLRGLRAGQRERIARSGNLTERTTLERIYGSTIWDALLDNPQLTGPEVARIAKNGAAPQPILTMIANNTAWLAKAEVRRALLSNPRLGGPHLDRVLRSLPREELRKVPQQTAYPQRVRAAAAKLLPR